jgi:hypothetical protein
MQSAPSWPKVILVRDTIGNGGGFAAYEKYFAFGGIIIQSAFLLQNAQGNAGVEQHTGGAGMTAAAGGHFFSSDSAIPDGCKEIEPVRRHHHSGGLPSGKSPFDGIASLRLGLRR